MAKAKKNVQPEPAEEMEGVAKDLEIEIKEVEPTTEEIPPVEPEPKAKPAKEPKVLSIEGSKVVSQIPDGDDVIVRSEKGITYKLNQAEYKNLLDGRK